MFEHMHILCSRSSILSRARLLAPLLPLVTLILFDEQNQLQKNIFRPRFIPRSIPHPTLSAAAAAGDHHFCEPEAHLSTHQSWTGRVFLTHFTLSPSPTCTLSIHCCCCCHISFARHTVRVTGTSAVTRVCPTTASFLLLSPFLCLVPSRFPLPVVSLSLIFPSLFTLTFSMQPPARRF